MTNNVTEDVGRNFRAAVVRALYPVPFESSLSS